ncbi:MAG: diguanylate cyclase [Eubacteriales bacterium]|nr:diguanylate cyclase [Eubacteriales bacterium]
MSSGIVRVFWKDAERRFVGVSKGFLDYYGFESQEALRGNTDEDMGWHIRPDSYMNDELEVIHEGVTTKDVPGTCICKGENRGILASKTPVYDKKGKIIGLIGCFVDRELVSAPDKSGGDAKRRDILTGLLNSRGISEEAYAYQDQYHLRNIDFIRIHVKILDFASINRQYGFDFSDKMLAELGNGLRKVFGVTSAVGRYSGNQFVILQQIHGTAALKDIRKRINQIAAGIRQIDDLPITFYVSVGCAVYSETLDLEKQRAAAEERMAEDQKKKEIQADIIGSF